MMPADVLEIFDLLASRGIEAWLDGGWGVDALLEEQTRDHDDLDLVAALPRMPDAIIVLASAGFRVTEDERPTRLVLRDDLGRQIDIHTVVFDAQGGGIQALPGGRSYRYPPEGFTGRGKVAGVSLPCMSASVQIECHLGYKPTDKDRRDVALLAGRFGLPLPSPYRSS
jgi:lincosamide nucleotidyltransferase A/C/D/E